MKIKNLDKISFIFIILVFSLSCISISYSGLFDTIEIQGFTSTWEDPASIGDFVWNDENQDGIQDPKEIGLSNVVVNLYNVDGDIIDTTVTDQDGLYAFYKLSPGEYYLEFITPTGYYFSPQDIGSNDSIDSDADAVSGKTITTILIPDENDGRWDAGMYTIS